MLTTTLPKILFLDIETVSSQSSFELLDQTMQDLWRTKARYWLRSVDPEQHSGQLPLLYQEKAGIYAEFGKVVCISFGLIILEGQSIHSFRIKSFAGADEFEILNSFAQLLNQHFNDPDKYFLCGHNIKEFDVPFLARRMIIHGIKLPSILNLTGKKPWETKFLLDTLDMWKFGDYKHFTSLKLLAKILNIPSPKDDIDGSEVGKVFWEEKDIDRIRVYCQKDVKTTAQVFLRLSGLDIIPDEKMIDASE